MQKANGKIWFATNGGGVSTFDGTTWLLLPKPMDW
jgi:hypothetical protein